MKKLLIFLSLAVALASCAGTPKKNENTEALTPEDVTEAVWWVATLPKHVNINTLEMMPVSQSFAGLSVHRQG